MEKTPTEWMLEPMRRYAQFTGRARRAEYWWFILFGAIVSVAASLIDVLLGLKPFGLSAVVSLAFLVPQLAVGFRRLHDLDRSGWWLAGAMILAIPFGIAIGLSVAGGGGSGAMLAGILALAIGAYSILLLVWFCQRGTVGPNRFGRDPLATD